MFTPISFGAADAVGKNQTLSTHEPCLDGGC